jgi:LacI family transcriptional regulator
VLVDREVQGFPDADVILVDNVKGGYDAVSYLIGLGHGRIGVVTGPITTTTGAGRLEGYYAACRETGIHVDQELVEVVSFKGETGIDATKRLLSLPNPPTAVFAANNALGEAALTVIREAGLNIPDDVSLVMFDDVPWACLTEPRITVVNQPTHDLGFVGMEVLDRHLRARDEGNEIARQKTMLMPELIIRESCAKPKTPS